MYLAALLHLLQREAGKVIYAEGAFISGKSNINDRRAVFTVISVVHTIEENIDKIFLNRSSDNATVLNIEKREIVRIKA